MEPRKGRQSVGYLWIELAAQIRSSLPSIGRFAGKMQLYGVLAKDWSVRMRFAAGALSGFDHLGARVRVRPAAQLVSQVVSHAQKAR